MNEYPIGRYSEILEYPEKISLCLPVKAGTLSSDLERCLKSIDDQSYKNFNLIIVDQSSSDAISHLLCDYVDNRTWAVVVKTDETSVVGHLNFCLDLAVGDYVKFILPENTLLVGGLETFAGILNEYSDVDIVSCPLAASDANEQYYITQFLKQAAIIPHELAFAHGLFEGNVTGELSGQIFRKSVIDEVELRFDPRLPLLHVFQFSLKMFFYGQNFAYTDQPQYVNHDHHNSRKVDPVDYFNEEFELRRLILEECKPVLDQNFIDGIKYKITITEKACNNNLDEATAAKLAVCFADAMAYLDSFSFHEI